jgi:putative tricarboxylic transport membrane protein
MTTTATAPDRTVTAWWKRRTGLVVPAIMAVISAVLFIGTATMVVPSTASFPGPQVFPLIVASATLILAIVLAIDTIRHPEPALTSAEATADGITDAVTLTPDAMGAAGLDELATQSADDGPEPVPLRPRSNVRALVGVVGTVVVFVAALDPVGWLISAAFLFWGVSRALGSRRPLFDIAVAFALSAVAQLAFSGGLGLHLPPGILEGSLSWMR